MRQIDDDLTVVGDVDRGSAGVGDSHRGRARTDRAGTRRGPAVERGRSTSAIADELHLSPWTVQDHLKAIFEKVGARSRGELVARLFFAHDTPRLTGPIRNSPAALREPAAATDTGR